MMSIDHGKPVYVLGILYLSPAFFSRLKGLSGKVLEWVQSYLEQRSQIVSIRGILCDVQFLYHRVQFLVHMFSQCMPLLLGLLRRNRH